MSRILRRSTVLASVTLVAATTGLAAATTAAASTQSLEPVRALKHRAVFDPRDIAPETIERARMTFRVDGQTKRRRVAAGRVRDAATTSTLLRLSKRSTERVRRLEVIVADEPTDPPPPAADPCQFGTFSSQNMPGACWRPYSDASPFNRQLPASIPEASGSAAMASRVGNFGPGPQIVAGGAGTEMDYDHPIYYSQSSDPIFTVHCTEPWGTCPLEGMEIRIPDKAQPAGGSDSHLAVIDQAAGWEYDLYDVNSKPAGGGTISIGWGGKTRMDNTTSDGLGSNATAAHFGLAAGVIRPAELASGQINHALAIAVKCTNGTSVAPAGSGTGRSCSSMGLSNQDAPPMGAHFFLDMSESEINALAVPEWRKVILRAMARYGMFVEDTGADYNGWSLIVESGASYTSFGQADPWVTLANDLNLPTWLADGIGRLHLFDLQGTVDWGSKLAVADPCVSQAAC